MFGFGFSGMRTAVMEGNLDKVKRLLSNGANPNATGEHGFTALHIAAINDRGEITAVLLAAGADVNRKSRSGETPLDMAIKGSQPDAAEALIEGGATQNPINGQPALQWMQSKFWAKEKQLREMNQDPFMDNTWRRMSHVISALRGGLV